MGMQELIIMIAGNIGSTYLIRFIDQFIEKYKMTQKWPPLAKARSLMHWYSYQ